MPQWTPDQARSYKEIASKARTAAAQARKIREKLLDKLVLEAAQRADVPKQDPSAQSPDPLLRLRLNNVNARLTECDNKLAEALQAKEVDGTLIKNLSTALGVLSELERTLSGRPMPGSLRPVAPRRQVAQFTPPVDG